MKKRPVYTGKTIFDSNLEIVGEKLQKINSIDKLEELSKEEKKHYNREGFYNKIKDRKNEIKEKERIMKEGIIDFEMLKKLLNDVPWYNEKKKKVNFNEKIRNNILKRDNNTCQLCKNNKVYLLCHHIIPNGSATDNNLIMLCETCHTLVHTLLKRKGYKYRRPPKYY